MFSLDKTPMDKAENAVLKLFPLHGTPKAKFQSLSEVGNLLHHIDCEQSLLPRAFCHSSLDLELLEVNFN